MQAKQSIRILVAEDNAINQQVIKRMLEHGGYAVRTVSHGGEAIEALQTGHYDLVIMDCLMPVMDGYAATRAIRASRSKEFDPQIPVLAITALATPGEREKCLAAGMTAYISKPVKVEQLSHQLQQLLELPDDPPAVTAQDPRQALAEILLSMSDRLLSDIETWRRQLLAFDPGGPLNPPRHLAHTIRGTADVLGEVQLSAVAAQLETSAATPPGESIAPMMMALVDALQRLEFKLKSGHVA